MIAEWDADGARQRFSGEILSSYMRPAPKVLRIVYLLGLTGDFKATLTVARERPHAMPSLILWQAMGLAPPTERIISMLVPGESVGRRCATTVG